MKRTLLFIPLIMFHFFVQGQKIESVEVDKFTGQKRVNTEYVNIAAGFTNVFKFKLRSVDSTCFLILMGTIAVGTVGINDPMIFLFEDKTTFKIYPTSVQSYNIGVGQYESNHYYHQYSISIPQLEELSVKKLISVRRYYNDVYSDIDVKEKNKDKIKSLSTLFLKQL